PFGAKVIMVVAPEGRVRVSTGVVSVRSSLPVAVSQSCTVASSWPPPAAIILPSGDRDKAATGGLKLKFSGIARCSVPVATSHRRKVLSTLAEAIILPSAEK